LSHEGSNKLFDAGRRFTKPLAVLVVGTFGLGLAIALLALL
jgi:hypothetical protein